MHAKLRPAVSPGHLIARPRLHDLLGECVDAPLTLVVAPAGSGKTSLLRTWFSSWPHPVAWLSLDESDQDPVQLWSGLLAALDVLAPGCPAETADLFRRPGRTVDAVGALLDELESQRRDDSVLVIDDLQLVDHDETIATSLALFVQHLPVWLHVVMSSRHTPPFRIHRLRARGQLGEVQFDELLFSDRETADLIQRLTPELAPDRASEIAARAGGWAASIQLAALAARAERALPDADVLRRDNNVQYLAGYVWEEVLAQERSDVVDVLRSTAVVERIDPGLAEALSQREDAQSLLAIAEERGLFTRRIEPTNSYEVHRLVRDVLMSSSPRDNSPDIAELHARAAAWFEASGQVVETLEHWLRADRPRDALRVLFEHEASLYDSGRESSILRIIESIPAAVASADIDAMVEYAWCHLLVDRHRYLQAVDRTVAWLSHEEPAPFLAARVRILASVASTIRGNWAESTELAHRGLTELGSSWAVDSLGRFGWNMLAREVALSERWDEHADEVLAAERSLIASPERRTAFEGVRALGAALSGQPIDALRVVAGVRQTSEIANLTILRAELGIAEALSLREIGEGARARAAFTEIAQTDVQPVPYVQLLARLGLVQVRIDEGDLDAAGAGFAQAEEMVETDLPGAGSRDWLARTGTTLALAAADLDGGGAWADRISDPFWSLLSSARVLLARSERDEAASLLAAAKPRCVRQQIVLGLTLAQSIQGAEARVEHLTESVQLAVRHGLVQTVASQGPLVVEAIERLAWQATDSWLDRLRRAAVADFGPAQTPAVEIIESLTDRELEVLRLLPSRLTMREIADELFISMNTVKFHVKVVYRKLGCSSRAEAVEIARRLPKSRSHPFSTRRR